jgi:hypothetical protein
MQTHAAVRSNQSQDGGKSAAGAAEICTVSNRRTLERRRRAAAWAGGTPALLGKIFTCQTAMPRLTRAAFAAAA